MFEIYFCGSPEARNIISQIFKCALEVWGLITKYLIPTIYTVRPHNPVTAENRIVQMTVAQTFTEYTLAQILMFIHIFQML